MRLEKTLAPRPRAGIGWGRTPRMLQSFAARRGAAVALCYILLAALLIATPVAAQTQRALAAGSPETAGAATQSLDSPEAVREMVSQLTDAEVRALLLERLDAVARERAAAESDGGLWRALGAAAGALQSSVLGAVERIPSIGPGVAQGAARFFAPRGWAGTLHLLAVGLAALGLGYAAERALLAAAPALPPREGGGLRPRCASCCAGWRQRPRAWPPSSCWPGR
jgi:hypothetical protein